MWFGSQLPWSTSNEDLVELFQTTGKVVEAEVLFEGGRSKGTGVVQFASVPEAETAISKFQGYSYGGAHPPPLIPGPAKLLADETLSFFLAPFSFLHAFACRSPLWLAGLLVLLTVRSVLLLRSQAARSRSSSTLGSRPTGLHRPSSNRASGLSIVVLLIPASPLFSRPSFSRLDLLSPASAPTRTVAALTGRFRHSLRAPRLVWSAQNQNKPCSLFAVLECQRGKENCSAQA